MFTENGYQPQQNVPNDFVTYDAKKSKKSRKKSKPKMGRCNDYSVRK